MIAALFVIIVGTVCTFIIAIVDRRRANDELTEAEQWERAMKALGK